MHQIRAFLQKRRYLFAGLVCGMLVLAAWLKIAGYPRGLQVLGIPAADRPFMDTRVLTDGVVAYRQGLDPMQNNVGDIEKRPLNYPRLWQAVFPLGLDRDDDRWLGALFVALFFAGIVIAPVAHGLAGSIAVAAAVFSPAVLFGLERGNTDLPVFFLLALAVALGRRSAVGALLVVLLAFALKLYPLAAIVVLWAQDWRVVRRLLWIAAAFALLYLLFTLSDLAIIKRSTIQSGWISFGMDVPWRWVATQTPWDATALRWLCPLLVLASLGWAGWKRGHIAPAEDGAALDGFRVGAACYAGSFILSTNFDYKQIPLLLTVPQLLIWSRTMVPARRWPARVALSGLYLSFWALTLEGLAAGTAANWIGFAIGELGQWTVFALMVWLLARTLPPWLEPVRLWKDFVASLNEGGVK